MRHADILIAGAGQAGAQVAAAVRSGGFEGSVSLIGEQAEPPYELPPLSKDYLAGAKAFDRMLLRPPDFWSQREIDLRGGDPVVAVDPVAHQVRLQGGETMSYSKLVWATGGHARRLSCEGADLAGVHTIRTRADVDRLRAELAAAGQIVVIGGGYIGLEAAAVLVKAGKSVVLLEASDRVLARVAGKALSAFYEAEHRSQGVDLRTGAKVMRLTASGGRVSGVTLADGSTITADLVVVGIGIVPAVEPLLEIGALGGDGVEVDGFCRTSLADVYAVGDIAAHANRFADGRMMRLESVQNANDQANVAARHMLGEGGPYDAAPWFWSNQYDLRLQTIGLSGGHDEVITRGDPGSRSFSLIYLRGGRIIAFDCVNATRDYAHGKPLLLRPAPSDRARLSDPAFALKDLR
jgi:3-phenylpropionate/trans-cinnamate dioxygenase ferredoxin reductase subunit